MGASINDTALDFKNKGNEAFKNGDWNLAIENYTKAIKNAEKDSKDLYIFYKNRAAAYLKKEDYEAALKDCDKALEIVPTDPKALYRRAQALESLERFEEAYRDARKVLAEDPKNKEIQPVLERLHQIVQERARRNAQTSTKVEQMFNIAFTLEGETEKREKAMKNILVLARETAGAEIMYKEGVVERIARLLKVEKNQSIRLNGIRVIGELLKNVDRTRGILEKLGLNWFLDTLSCNREDEVNAVQYCIQAILNSLSGMDNKEESKPQKELCDKHQKEIDMLLSLLLHSVTNRTFTGLARDAVLELITRNIHYTTLNWAERLVEIKGLQRIMEIASELKEYKYESTMDITDSTHTIASVCLARIYENMYYDQARQNYLKNIEEYINDKLLTPDIESKVRVTVAITALLVGPTDVGNQVISKEGIMEMILVMAGTDDVLQQKVACECIIAAASKKDKALAIVKQGVDILKKLYANNKNDGIRIRALVGLCKLGSSGGTDASIQPFAEGSTRKLAEACRRFLVNPKKDPDLRKWAAEGLSYLTLDADVKEKLIEDRDAIKALIELAKTGNQSVLYGVVTTLVNLCNAYEKQEVIPEMIELAKFAKQHIPQEHELDDPDFVSKRINILGKEGVTYALVALSKTESKNSRELISRVFNALCSEKDLRGIVVQQGGVKALLSLALEGTDKGKKHAAQALARIGVNMNPEVAFPGQRMLEVIRPLISLLHPDCSALENFEALLTLCNIASINETARKRIIKDGGLPKIEHFMYEDHDLLRRASTQVITNMVFSPDVIKIYEGENDRTKYLLILCGDEDTDTALAASGALATLTLESKKCCRKLFELESWLENMHCLLANPNNEIQYRGVYIINNMINCSKEVAEKLIATDIMEILMALTKQEGDEKKKIKALAAEALEAAEKWKLIKKPVEGESDDD